MNQNPKILLLNPPSNCVNDDRLEPPLGLLYIAATLMENGYDASFFDMSGCKNEQEISDKITNTPEADIYGINSFCTNYRYTKKVINQVRTIKPSAYIVAGGPNPSAIPDFTLMDSGVDAVAVGEGEDVFKECVDSYTQGENLTGVIMGKPRQDIDSYAFPARNLVDFSTYSRKLMNKPAISLLSSRGCRYHCIHCNSVVMGGGSSNVRYRSPDNIIEEMTINRDVFENYRFNDDHFTGNPQLEELLKKMKDLDITFRIFARVDDLDEKTCQLLKEAGCVHVSIGLESLNADNLKILGKASQIGKEKNIKIAKSYGLIIRSSLMVGLPYDTDKTINESFREASQLGLDEFAVYPLIPYPGTLIWEMPERFGYTIINNDFTDYIQMGKNDKTCYALKHKNFDPEHVQRWKVIAEQILESGGARHMRESEVAK